jgi:hypothetical protein
MNNILRLRVPALQSEARIRVSQAVLQEWGFSATAAGLTDRDLGAVSPPQIQTIITSNKTAAEAAIWILGIPLAGVNYGTCNINICELCS